MASGEKEMRRAKDILKEFIPAITIFIFVGVISYQFMPRAPEVEQADRPDTAEPRPDALKLYQEFARLERLKKTAFDAYYEEHSKLQEIRDDFKLEVDENPDDLEVLRKWVRVLKRITSTRTKYTKARTSAEEKMGEILKQLEALGEPPPR